MFVTFTCCVPSHFALSPSPGAFIINHRFFVSQGCKRFRSIHAYREKLRGLRGSSRTTCLPSKCDRCRNRGRAGYRAKKEAAGTAAGPGPGDGGSGTTTRDAGKKAASMAGKRGSTGVRSSAKTLKAAAGTSASGSSAPLAAAPAPTPAPGLPGVPNALALQQVLLLSQALLQRPPGAATAVAAGDALGLAAGPALPGSGVTAESAGVPGAVGDVSTEHIISLLLQQAALPSVPGIAVEAASTPAGGAPDGGAQVAGNGDGSAPEAGPDGQLLAWL